MTWQAKAQCLLPAIARGDFQRFRKNVNIGKHLLSSTEKNGGAIFSGLLGN